eukprot:TRINITY_DN1595_c0_g3_i1.p1 TRINITY_DN1595_c0_g3~~TRINITY_DN1595_c0_g3_i1.p1  ORF type:complete len:337 (-),score=75.55 TRINITY_DN1595_c0_g3_i1:33-1043(-)
MSIPKVKLPHTDFEGGVIGLGLMGFTWRPVQTPDDQAFETMRSALEKGSNIFNGGAFYGYPEPTLNLQLLNRYFTKYPEDADRVFLSIKGAVNIAEFKKDGSAAGIRRNIEEVVKILGPNKKLDLFEPARVDKSVTIEETVGAIAELIKEGKVKYIGLSEVSAATIRKAHAVHPIAMVEIEYSIWSTEAETNGVLDTCKELGITVIAYSPLGRGILTAKLEKPEDVPHQLRQFERFQGDNFHKNLEFVEVVKKVAKNNNCTEAQVSLAWILKEAEIRKQVIIPIPGSTRKNRCLENINSAFVKLSAEDYQSIRDVISKVQPAGGRYNKHLEGSLWG